MEGGFDEMACVRPAVMSMADLDCEDVVVGASVGVTASVRLCATRFWPDVAGDLRTACADLCACGCAGWAMAVAPGAKFGRWAERAVVCADVVGGRRALLPRRLTSSFRLEL